jgi:hypothetical protein
MGHAVLHDTSVSKELKYRPRNYVEALGPELVPEGVMMKDGRW